MVDLVIPGTSNVVEIVASPAPPVFDVASVGPMGPTGPMLDYGDWRPVDQAMLCWTYDPTINTSGVGGSGTTYLNQVHLPVAGSVTGVTLHVWVAGAGLTTALAGLYDTAFNRLAITADQSAAWVSAGSRRVPFTAPVTLPAGSYYIAMLTVGTTAVQWPRSSGSSVFNAGLLAGQERFQSLAGQTTLPPVITGAIPALNAAWAGLY